MTEMQGTVTNCSYDLLNRLTQAIQKNSGGTQTASYGYGYDAVGNMTSKAINGSSTSMAYNAADQLTSAGSASYSYDPNGNQTGSSGGVSLAYNSQDQTTGMTYTGAGQAERTGNGTSSYTYDGTGMGLLSNAAGTTYFTNGPNGQLISERVPGKGTYYYLFDGLGSVVGVTDSSGNVVNRYSYDPYGNTTSVTEGVSNPFRYIGAVWDSSTGLYQMGERYYDPKLGRFTQTDPLGGGYGYTSGNPINRSDRSGLLQSDLSTEEVNIGTGGEGAAAGEFGTRGRTIPKRSYRLRTGVKNGVKALQKIRANRWQAPKGWVGPKQYKNLAGHLPKGGDYWEYDVMPKYESADRGVRRLVIDARTGNAWYSRNHGETWNPIPSR